MASRINIVYTSIYSLLGGFGLEGLMSFFTDESEPLYTLPLKVGGVLGIAYYFWHLSKFDRIFMNLDLGIDNVYPLQKSVRYYDKSTVYKFTLPTGLDVEQIKNKQGAIEQWLGKKVTIEYINKGLFIIEVFNNSLATMYNYDNDIKVDGEISFPVGYDLHEKLVTCCLSNLDNNTNMLIAGSIGGGKSILLKVILTYLITHKDILMYLVDLKGTELPIFEKCSCVQDICYEKNKILSLLKDIKDLMEKRYATFHKYGVRDIKAYNQKMKRNPMKYMLLAIDEFAELMEDDESQTMLEHIIARSRAAGISVIISTQRPDAKVISSRIKACICVIAGLRTSTDINSRIIMDNDLLSDLKGNGHCIFRYGIKDTELQCLFITDKLIEQLIKPFEVDKTKEVDKPKENNINEQYKVDITDMEAFH